VFPPPLLKWKCQHFDLISLPPFSLFFLSFQKAYWPQDTPDFRTVTISLALNDATTENGCLRVVPGSQKEKNLRQHRPLMAGRDGRWRGREGGREGVCVGGAWLTEGEEAEAAPAVDGAEGL